MLTKEELEHSFAQVKFSRPMNADPPVLVETPPSFLLKALDEENLIHLLFSYTEINYLTSRYPKAITNNDELINLVQNISDSQEILEKLNASIISLLKYDFIKGHGKKIFVLLSSS